jgi:hypothetical protein
MFKKAHTGLLKNLVNSGPGGLAVSGLIQSFLATLSSARLINSHYLNRCMASFLKGGCFSFSATFSRINAHTFTVIM